MLRYNRALCPFATRITSSLLLVLVCALSFNTHRAQAGSGTTVDIPASNIAITMDGVCNPAEYSDGIQVNLTVGTSLTFPIYMKHTIDDAYFCFGGAAGLPLPAHVDAQPQVAIYIDLDDDGVGMDSDDFGVWMPYETGPGGTPWARFYGTGGFNGPDPGGWQAVKYQTLAPDFWTVEFKISRQTLWGWKHRVGLALFYHWWAAESDDYSWPANRIWGSPQWWGNGRFTTSSVDIDYSPSVPTMDGQCGSEYSDAAMVHFNAPNGAVSAYLEHSLADLYVCLQNLTIPSAGLQGGRNAAVYLDRLNTGGDTPDGNDLLFTISYSGLVQANSGDGSGFTGPDPGGYVVMGHQFGGSWDAEFQISGATIERWWSRSIGITVAEQEVANPGDLYGWPTTGFYATVPYTWGKANLLHLGSQNFLSFIVR